jgi:hypothetical protein
MEDSKITEVKTFNLTFRYIYDVLTINKKEMLIGWISFTYNTELEIKEIVLRW